MLAKDEMRFILVVRDLGMHRLPKKLQLPKSVVKTTRLDGSQFEMSLFDAVPEESLNSLEREVASFLDEQSQLYFWYRNIPRSGYYVQGWQKSRIYADFIFTTCDGDRSDFRKVFVLETKGIAFEERRHGLQAVGVRQAVQSARAEKDVELELVPAMRGKEITYDVVYQDEWEKRLNELLG